MVSTQEEDPQKCKPLTEEEMKAAVEQIVFDLGVDTDQARKWAKEAQEELIKNREAKVSKEVVTVVADSKHIDDEDVPAELVPRSHEAKDFLPAVLAKSVVNAVKTTYGKVRN